MVEITYKNVQYTFKKHIDKDGNETPYYNIAKVRRGSIDNETQLCREILIDMGYNPKKVNEMDGNLRLAGYIRSHLLGKVIKQLL